MLPQAVPHAVNDAIAQAIGIAEKPSKSIRPQRNPFFTTSLEVSTP
jgi:hypothetical protein